jgi:hypothetical protein
MSRGVALGRIRCTSQQSGAYHEHRELDIDPTKERFSLMRSALALPSIWPSTLSVLRMTRTLKMTSGPPGSTALN